MARKPFMQRLCQVPSWPMRLERGTDAWNAEVTLWQVSAAVEAGVVAAEADVSRHGMVCLCGRECGWVHPSVISPYLHLLPTHLPSRRMCVPPNQRTHAQTGCPPEKTTPHFAPSPRLSRHHFHQIGTKLREAVHKQPGSSAVRQPNPSASGSYCSGGPTQDRRSAGSASTGRVTCTVPLPSGSGQPIVTACAPASRGVSSVWLPRTGACPAAISTAD